MKLKGGFKLDSTVVSRFFCENATLQTKTEYLLPDSEFHAGVTLFAK